LIQKLRLPLLDLPLQEAFKAFCIRLNPLQARNYGSEVPKVIYFAKNLLPQGNHELKSN
jgi:hypothetical protein